MRQIVFRGRCFNSPTWVYGFPYIEGIDTNGETWVSIRQPKENGGFTSYTVDPETVGQFTGLYDKNGLEIYEGDLLNVFILPFVEPETVTVKWNENEASYILFIDEKSHSFYRFREIMESEVIGNIHNNKELLTQN